VAILSEEEALGKSTRKRQKRQGWTRLPVNVYNTHRDKEAGNCRFQDEQVAEERGAWLLWGRYQTNSIPRFLHKAFCMPERKREWFNVY
jgi:hypothetical protein